MIKSHHLLKADTRRLYAWVLLALFLPALSLSAFDLYWTEQKRILASDIDGSNQTVIFDGETSSPTMTSFAVDIAVTDSHIYWSGHDGGDIWRANRDGSGATQLIPNAGTSIHFLEINEAKNRLYYTDFNHAIVSATLEGTNIEQRGWQALPYTGLAMAKSDATADELLVLTATDNQLRRFLPEQWDSRNEAELPESSIQTYGLAFDPDTQDVFYTNFGNNTLNVYNLETKEHRTLLTPGMTQPLGVKLSPSRTHLLIAERGRGISAYQLDNEGYELIVESENAHFGVAVTADPNELSPPPPPPVGMVLWSTDFEQDVVGELPNVNWRTVGAPTTGTAQVVQDTENVFGFGTDNQFLRADQVVSFNLRSENFVMPVEVVTFGFDFIGHFKEGDGRWLQAAIRTPLSGTWAHITSILMSNEVIRQAPNEPSYGANGLPVRLETIYNNSPEAITYEDPAGNEHTIRSAEAALWAYHHTTETWELLVDSYTYYREISETGPFVDHFNIFADGNSATRTFDLDNVEVRLGASFPDLEGEVILPEPLPVADDGEVFWATDFENDTPGELPTENWGTVSGPGGGEASVVIDTENDFGFGTDNRFLRVDGAYSFSLTTETFWTPAEIVTLSFDFIGRYEEGDGRWINIFFRAGSARTHITSLAMPSETLRGAPGAPSYGGNDLPVRLETIMNNSGEMIEYSGPDGRTYFLESGMASVWAYHHTQELWEQLAVSYNYSRDGGGLGQIIDNIHILVDGGSGTLRRFDMDNITVTNGAHLSDLEGDIYTPPFHGHLEVDFEGVPTGEITRDNVESFVHGNLSGIGFFSTYGVDGNPHLLVAEDTENRFGEGTDNKILRTNGALNWIFRAENNFNEEVMTFRMDMIAEQIVGGRLMSRFVDGAGNVVSQVDFDATGSEGGFRNLDGDWPYGTLHRFEVVINNSLWPILYPTPSGIAKELLPKGTDIWINGDLVVSNYTETHSGSWGPIMGYEMRSFSTNPWDADIGLIQTLAGAQLVGVEPGSGFADWTADNFPGATDPAIIGPEADPDSDGIPNLLEYALGLDPLGADRSGLPVHGLELLDVGGEEADYLTLSFTSPDSVTDVSFDVFASSDLGGATEDAVLYSVIPNGDGTSTYLFRDSEPVDVSERRFLQLEVNLIK